MTISSSAFLLPMLAFSGHAPTTNLAAPLTGPRVLLDANSTSQTDILNQTSVTAAKTFRVGVILNASARVPLNSVFGWQFAINYDPTILVPQADPFATSSYPDGSGNTVLFGAQASANWAAKITGGSAFGGSNVPPGGG